MIKQETSYWKDVARYTNIIGSRAATTGRFVLRVGRRAHVATWPGEQSGPDLKWSRSELWCLFPLDDGTCSLLVSYPGEEPGVSDPLRYEYNVARASLAVIEPPPFTIPRGIAALNGIPPEAQLFEPKSCLPEQMHYNNLLDELCRGADIARAGVL